MSFVDLSHYQFIRVSGVDSFTFLQGQLSCNMDLLTDTNSLRGALCNLKGRVIADFRVLRLGDDCLLQTGPGMATAILETLARYAVFSKVELAIETGVTPVYGAFGEEELTRLREQYPGLPDAENQVLQLSGLSIIRLPGSSECYELWFLDQDGDDIPLPDLVTESSASTMAAWQRLELEAGIIHVSPELSENYTPQLLNYDISGVIDFNKGCYTGQEVVARMYYRGQTKKRLYLLASEHAISDESVLLEIKESNEITAEILSFSNADQGSDDTNLLLAIISTETADGKGQLVLSENPDSFLQILTMPYTE